MAILDSVSDVSARALSPTDVTTFIRLEQCERYLRLRLHERRDGLGFMKDFGVVPQTITPLLQLSGSRFETELENDFKRDYRVLDCARDGVSSRNRESDNAMLLQTAIELPRGETAIVLQPRIESVVGHWKLRGDIDILRLNRTDEGALHLLVVDAKSSKTPKIEHRLQVAFYHEMLAMLFGDHDIGFESIELGVLYRGAEETEEQSEAAKKLRDLHFQNARDIFGTERGFLELVEEKDDYLQSVRELVTGDDSRAARVSGQAFETVPFHLSRKCDACSYQEFCLKWSAQHDDLSLVPHISAQDKGALQRNGITTIQQLSQLKQFRRSINEHGISEGEAGQREENQREVDQSQAQERQAQELSGVVSDEESSTRSDALPAYASELVATPGKEALVQRVAATYPVGPRLDELVHRARRYRRWRGDEVRYAHNIPSKGYGSLPFCAADHNPNLLRIYIDAQHDYLHDRIYLLGALVVASENGEIARRRHIVHLATQPLGAIGELGDDQSDAREAELFLGWSRELLAAVYELAAPDDLGEKNAPLHLIFWDSSEQQTLLEGLGRHATTILGATPLYDFVTQIAAFDSPVVSFLEQEIRELKNYPLVAQTLQSVSAHRGFKWDAMQPLRTIFHERHFDVWGKLDEDEVPPGDENAWFARRARYCSSIPLEYSYAAWKALPIPAKGSDSFAPFRGATLDNLRFFQERRLDALEFIASDFMGNKQTLKSSFALPDLATFDGKAQTLAHALDEFVTIERHVEIAAWKKARLAPPERRMVAGDTLVVRYLESDQNDGIAQQNRDNEVRRLKHEAWKEANPDIRNRPKDVMEETRWSMEKMRFRLRLDCASADCDLDHALATSTLRAKSGVVISKRVEQDSRLAQSERVDFTPTVKQLLYGMRADIIEIETQRDANERVQAAWIVVEISPLRNPSNAPDSPRGFVFFNFPEPFFDGILYTLDANPDDWMGNHCSGLMKELCEGANSVLLNRLKDQSSTRIAWPEVAAKSQARFLEGLDAFAAIGQFHALESGKRDFIARHGDAPVLLVQGPPGTGKSYSTAFALLARMQGAMAAEQEFRIWVSCKTHAATDVLMQNIIAAQNKLRLWSNVYPKLFQEYFDARLLQAPIYRLAKTETIDGAIALPKKEELEKGQPPAFNVVSGQSWCFVATTPGGTRRLLKEAGKKDVFAWPLCACLVLDEASQMNLPEAVMASLTLQPDGQLIVVGDHRQMPPIIKHDWQFEPRRTFAEFKSYASLFETLLELPIPPPKINFEESFRLHRDMAEFLRREIYRHDGIRYHSRKTAVLKPCEHDDDFVRAALSPSYPLVVIVHSESGSLLSNAFERKLITPLLEALSHADKHALDGADGLGIVVPHRAQKAALQDARWNVDTVERFQGDERTAILVGATESDRDYLLQNGKFLLDPRRLTVALSRAKQKMILVASQTVFDVFSPDEETFANAQLWKNLLRHTCTEQLWSGERDGEQVQVWGNVPKE